MSELDKYVRPEKATEATAKFKVENYSPYSSSIAIVLSDCKILPNQECGIENTMCISYHITQKPIRIIMIFRKYLVGKGFSGLPPKTSYFAS